MGSNLLLGDSSQQKSILKRITHLPKPPSLSTHAYADKCGKVLTSAENRKKIQEKDLKIQKQKEKERKKEERIKKKAEKQRGKKSKIDSDSEDELLSLFDDPGVCRL